MSQLPAICFHAVTGVVSVVMSGLDGWMAG
jgi:hypothetical protein